MRQALRAWAVGCVEVLGRLHAVLCVSVVPSCSRRPCLNSTAFDFWFILERWS